MRPFWAAIVNALRLACAPGGGIWGMAHSAASGFTLQRPRTLAAQ